MWAAHTISDKQAASVLRRVPAHNLFLPVPYQNHTKTFGDIVDRRIYSVWVWVCVYTRVRVCKHNCPPTIILSPW